MFDGTLTLVGGGKMGSALLKGWLNCGLDPTNVFVVEPNASRHNELAEFGAISVVSGPSELPEAPTRVLVMAVKPQMMSDVLPDYAARVGSNGFVVSIAAGTPISTFEKAFGEDRAIVRAMPNTPAAVGAGMTVLCANSPTSDDQRALAEQLLAAVGDTAWIDDEELMHAVTAVSGSGPAYVFHLVECMAAAGEQAGLSADLAMRLARKTVCGAGALMTDDPTQAATLRENVTSPGGTTQAALGVLMDGSSGFPASVAQAVAAASARSKELA